MKGRFLLFPLAAAVSLCLSSCSLIPEEEAVRTAPVVREYTPRIHKFAEVQRGELSVKERVTCKFVPVKSENLSFALGGEVVDKVLVHVGEMVEEGQLLAQLELNGLDEQIAQAQISVEESKLRLKNLVRRHELERRRNELAWAGKSLSEIRQAEQALEEKLSLEKRALEDALSIAEMELETLNEKLAERQIRAPFSGAVTYVHDFEPGELSQFGVRAMVLSDSTVSLFKADSANWDKFKPGDVYEITVNQNAHTIMVTDEAELGLAPQEKTPGKRADVYFVLQEPDFTLEEGAFGYIDLVLEHRNDTLYVPKGAVKASSEDRQLVFYLREDGLRAYKEVKTGIRNNNYVEILSGLSEGEQIIVD
ncbi:MAG: efflux RND transporter periplasmic adaptor subunit [Clostridia bacterium]|nr:efflux RND transporter periplasmic adaptor subunit [Clostridia bacterium]